MSFDAFFHAMQRFVPAEGRIMACQFRGDPNADIQGKWRARIVNNPDHIDQDANVYLCVSAMKKNSRGEFRRRKENYCGGLLLMIDDLGDGPGSKFPLSTIEALPPTALIETSPANFQAVYFFDRLVDDLELFDSLIRSFIERKFLGEDTGQAGVNRVFRPPAGINGKPKYGKWRVRLADWHPELRYSPQEIAQAFGLSLQKRVAPPRDMGMLAAAKGDRIRAFVDARASLRAAGMLKAEDPDYSGWIPIHCPWIDHHTGEADNGASIRIPEVENQWFGAFRCHHGHCSGKGWRELTDWLSEEQSELLDMINYNAPDKW